MPAAPRAGHLGTDHAVAQVAVLLDRLAERLVEGGPAAARVVLGVGLEELRAAAGAQVDAGLEDLVVLAGERRLGALEPEHAVLLRRELCAPLGVGLDDLVRQAISFVRCALQTCASPGSLRAKSYLTTGCLTARTSSSRRTGRW